MIGTVARKEIVSNILSYKFTVVLLLMALLLAASLFIMHRDFAERTADYQVIRPAPGAPTAVVPPNPLSIFAKGLENAMTRSFEIGVIGVDVRAGQSSGNVIFSFFPAPDFLYIVRVVLSLVALLLGFDQISSERERGTLKLMLSGPVSRAEVLLGKWLGNFASLAAPFLLVTALGTAAMLFDADIRFSAGQLGRFALILALALLYMAFFLSLGMLVSALTRRSATSVIALLFVWALLVFVLPNLGTLVARQFVATPSVQALNEKRAQTWTREILLGIAEGGGLGERMKTISREEDRMEEDFRLKFERLVRLARNINRLSPAAGFLDAATGIAGTGIDEEIRLKAEVIRYKNSIIDPVIADLLAGKRDPAYPAFTYRYRPLGEVFASGAMFDAAWLAAFNILAFALAYAGFARADAR
ncbi:MAG TPA: ABC transporter permease subunit [Candidatus Aminicenantes bacterium]|nr:ABC transporter permease subunit [Candidatus Aminicenantes bacterium]